MVVLKDLTFNSFKNSILTVSKGVGLERTFLTL